MSDPTNKREIIAKYSPEAVKYLYAGFKEAKLETHISGTFLIEGEYFQLIFAKIGCEAPDTPHAK